MKHGGPATEDERKYALRRVIYDAMVAARGVTSFPTIRGYSSQETMKLAALIMARNLDAFFFLWEYPHDDDINYTDFQLDSWAPKTSAKLKKPVRKRINKIVGHVVSSKPDPFKKRDEVENIVIPLIREACEFVHECLKQGVATYTGDAEKYRRRLNGMLPKLGIGKLPSK